MNIRFSYLYRDYSNYKNFNALVFSNPNHKSVSEIRNLIKSSLIEGQWFYASEWEVSDLHFKNWDDEDDHFLHEFESIEETIDESEPNNLIDNFLNKIRKGETIFI